MTCIVGLVENGTVYIGGDSATTTGNRRTVRSTSKAVKRGEFVMGGAGYAVITMIMNHVTELPPMYENQTPIDYMVNTFLPMFRATVLSMGQMIIEDSKESTDSLFLIGFRGHLFRIGQDLNVIESIDGFDCIGSGGDFALGVMYATHDSGMKPEDRIYKALNAAAYFDSYVYPPFEIEFVESSTVEKPEEKEEKGILDGILQKANKMMEKEEE